MITPLKFPSIRQFNLKIKINQKHFTRFPLHKKTLKFKNNFKHCILHIINATKWSKQNNCPRELFYNKFNENISIHKLLSLSCLWAFNYIFIFIYLSIKYLLIFFVIYTIKLMLHVNRWICQRFRIFLFQITSWIVKCDVSIYRQIYINILSKKKNS